MRKLLTSILCALLLGGCATTKPEKETAPNQQRAEQERQGKGPKKQENAAQRRTAQSKRLARALDLLEEGDAAGASKLLTAICSARSVPGVTDEALFRLALLTLKPSPERAASRQGQHLLRRLREEYPSSPWTLQAAPLIELINIDEDVRHQNRSLKSNNQALTKKINELNDTIEQLKHLDLELEQKNR
jgi:outer membrane PBP1 activator LpoA protein